jgi:hypothetical protein
MRHGCAIGQSQHSVTLFRNIQIIIQIFGNHERRIGSKKHCPLSQTNLNPRWDDSYISGWCFTCKNQITLPWYSSGDTSLVYVLGDPVNISQNQSSASNIRCSDEWISHLFILSAGMWTIDNQLADVLQRHLLTCHSRWPQILLDLLLQTVGFLEAFGDFTGQTGHLLIEWLIVFLRFGDTDVAAWSQDVILRLDILRRGQWRRSPSLFPRCHHGTRRTQSIPWRCPHQ